MWRKDMENKMQAYVIMGGNFIVYTAILIICGSSLGNERVKEKKKILFSIFSSYGKHSSLMRRTFKHIFSRYV